MTTDLKEAEEQVLPLIHDVRVDFFQGYENTVVAHITKWVRRRVRQYNITFSNLEQAYTHYIISQADWNDLTPEALAERIINTADRAAKTLLERDEQDDG